MRRRGIQIAVVVAGLLPFFWLVFQAFRGELEAEPIKDVTHRTGLWALRLLIASLAITPLRRYFGLAAVAPLRRTLGLLAFFYTTLHFLIYAVLDLWDAWSTLVEDVLERPYITVGVAGFLCLVPLAITSTQAWIRRLGKRWVRLHRLAYVAAILGCIHFLWLVKQDLREPLVYTALLALLLLSRVVAWLRPDWLAALRGRKRASIPASS